ncbi:PAS domain-containing protein (plasmid) [Phormidium sp. CLA17]|uniref:sensor histidine kinase n=1 Tax=Leptolyngbya sp. Cla-17 TaxID=2803751 RepID=UPI001491F657|nr:PAS domain-containing protein [Leptolyngbya sp. Cla-17]MBM0744787.1 PAS domain-containing protein [Leptolyngbya sp. Cla-17]
MSLSRVIQDSLALKKRGQSKLSPANCPDTAKYKGERFAVCAASEPERQQLSAMLYSYERIISATSDCVSLIDRNYIYQVVNQTYLTWHQKAYDEIVGHSFSDLLGQDFFETVCKPLLDKCLAGATEQTVESWKDYGDGQRRYAKATYAPYVELDGTISGVVINVQDLTDLKLAELENQALQERMQFLFAASPGVVYSCEAGGSFACTYISENVTRMFGYTPADFLGGSDFWAKRLHPDDAPKLFAGLPRLFKQGHHSHEYRFQHRDGHYCWVQDDLRLIQNLEGEPLEIVGCWMIIDARKAAEAALERSQRQYQTLVENSPDIIERFDPQLRHLYISPALTKITGMATDVFLGKTCRELGMDEGMVNTWEAAACSLLTTGRKQLIEFETPTLDGFRSYEMAVVPELSDQHAIESLLCISRDVTERKAAEAALREQQQFTEQIADSTLAILYVYDLIEQRNIYCNQQIAVVLGYSVDEIRLMDSDLLPGLTHPDDLPQMMANHQRLLMVQDDEFVETEYRIRHKDGNYRWFLSRDRIFSRTADGLPKQLLGVATDITVQKQTQAVLHQQAMRQRLLMVVTQNIRQTLDLSHILETTVTEVRQFLQTDRVLIYQFNSDWSGSVIAESVAAGWQSILGMEITDTYFVNTQGEAYKRGRIRVSDDIYADNLEPCHLALLERIQTRAKLVVPILQADHLWGFLIAQHCQSPRHWEASEIELQRQLAMQLAIAIQQAELYQQVQTWNTSLELQVQERTAQLQQALDFEALLKCITDQVRDSLDEGQILQAAVEALAHGLPLTACDTGIYNAEQTTSTIAYECTNTLTPAQGYTFEIATAAHAEIYPQLFRGQTCHFTDITPDPLRLDQQRQTTLAVPIVDDQGSLGDLWLFKPPGSVFHDQEVRLVKQVANQCAIALRQSRLYQAAQTQVKELERFNQLKDDFLSTASHELRSPMSSIKMAIQMLEISLEPLGVLEDKANAIHCYFNILREEANREITLINDLLDMARLDAGTESLTLTTIALQYYIPHLAEAFSERTRQQQQHLAIHIPDHLPDFSTDLPYLERLLTELLHNACKYTPAGERITVSAQSTSEILEICVSNTGVEIPASECDRIFDKFYRLPNSDPWKHGGTGLGLALVKKLTERLGGQIHVCSGDGQTTFRLEFTHGSAATDKLQP